MANLSQIAARDSDRRATEASLGRVGPELYEVTASHYMSPAGLLRTGNGNSSLNVSALAGSRLDRDFTSCLAQALLHAEKAKTFYILDRSWFKTLPVPESLTRKPILPGLARDLLGLLVCFV